MAGHAGLAGLAGRACEQSSDAKPMSHWHVPLKHVPCPVQLEGHSPRTPAQSSPKKPTSHKQLKLTLAPARPAAHSPWPEQFFGHTPSTTEQSAPSKPASQRHSPKAHAPWPEQLAAQPPNAATTPQSSPWKPGSQRQRPCPVPGSLSRKHSPCAEQLFGQPPTTMLQSPPEYPKSHSHSPAKGPPTEECRARSCAGCSVAGAGVAVGEGRLAGRAPRGCSPLVQLPCPVQLLMQSGAAMEQSLGPSGAPPKPGSQLHTPLVQMPCPEQLKGQSCCTTSHLLPVNPGLQWQPPLRQ